MPSVMDAVPVPLAGLALIQLGVPVTSHMQPLLVVIWTWKGPPLAAASRLLGLIE